MSYTVRRQGFGPEVPFGKAGVAGVMAALFAVIGLMVPTHWLEAAAFQLYLDAIVPTAIPPFGMVAHIVAAALLAVVGGLIGWALARAFGVEASDFGFDSVLNRLRGVGREDEADAPGLRAADRHPDAPARRPFSVAQDVPVPAATDDAPVEPADAVVLSPHEDEGDELLLDAHFADPEPMVLTEVAPVADEPVAAEAPIADSVAEPEVVAPEPEPIAPPVEYRPVEAEAPIEAPVAEAVAETPVAAAPPPRPVAEPIDVSAGRLDELLARLEAGLARRQSGTADMAPPASPANDAAAPAPDGTMPVPDDPALAAALATLRRMRQHVG